MADEEMRTGMSHKHEADPAATSRQRVWNLLDRHPELYGLVRVGDLVARYRFRTSGNPTRYWSIDWASIHRELETILTATGTNGSGRGPDPMDTSGA